MLDTTFHAFTPTHAAAVILSVAGWIALAARVRRASDPAVARGRMRWIGIVFLASAALSTAVEFLPGFWNKDISLPLHLCDMAWFAGGAALLSERRIFRTLIYFWGFGLSSEAFLTPTLRYGPATFDFWSFWICHFQILAAAILTVGAGGYRPHWRDWRFAVLTTGAYAAVVTGINLLIDTNYCFTGKTTPATKTVLDVFGPWPGRLAWIAVVPILLFALMTAPFAWRRRSARTD